MNTEFRVPIAVASFAVLSIVTLVFASERSDFRVSTGATAVTTDVLEERGYFFEEWIGDDFVQLTWASGSLSMEVDEKTVSTLQSFESTSPEVVAFTAYDGKLKGWLYLDEFDEVLVEFEALDTYATYQVTAPGASEVITALICRCRKPGFPAICTNQQCDDTDTCPGDASHFCAWKYGVVAEFEVAFNIVTL